MKKERPRFLLRKKDLGEEGPLAVGKGKTEVALHIGKKDGRDFVRTSETPERERLRRHRGTGIYSNL